MRGFLFLATAALSLIAAPSAEAVKRVTQTYDIELYHKQYLPDDNLTGRNLTISPGDVVRICNHDNFQHRPFSWSEYNKFETILRMGECFEWRASNPTDSARTLRLYDSIHSQERMIITVLSLNATFDPSDQPPPPDREWAVYIEQDSALCCLHDVFDYYPYKKDGELPYELKIAEIAGVEGRSDVRVLRRGLSDERTAKDWVCGHDVLQGGRWTRNYARIEGVLVGNLPCEANIARPY